VCVLCILMLIRISCLSKVFQVTHDVSIRLIRLHTDLTIQKTIQNRNHQAL